MQAANDRAKSLEASVESLKADLHTAQLSAASQARQTKELEGLLTEERLSHEQVRTGDLSVCMGAVQLPDILVLWLFSAAWNQ